MEFQTKGHCNHGEFVLTEGCSQCISERLAGQLKAKLEAQESKPNIVKVRYFSETTGELSEREYTYYSVDPLNVGDVVIVPVKDTTGKAKVSGISIPETEIQAFKDKLKTILTGSLVKVKEKTFDFDPELTTITVNFIKIAEAARVDAHLEAEREFSKNSIEGQERIRIDKESRGPLLTTDPNAWRTGGEEQRTEELENTLTLVKPEMNPELMKFYSQAVSLREFAVARVITCNNDLKPANDDLIIIRKVKKAMEEKRKEYLKPFQDHVKETNEAYKTLMEPIEEADKITAGKMLAFDAEQKRKIREAEAIEDEKLALARREAELKGGEITIDLTPIEKPEVVPDRIRTLMGSSGQRDNWKWEVEDITLIPREYLMINAGMLTPIVKASKGKLTIPGVRIYNEPIIAYRS